MVFRRLNRSIRPVHRIKHQVDIQGGSALGVNTVNQLIDAVDAPTIGAVRTVETGSTVNGIYLKCEAYATTAGALSNAYMIVFKSPGGNIANIIPNAVGSSDDKRYVIHSEMVMLQKEINGNPRTLFAGVIAIPRGFRRFGINDRLNIGILAPGVNIDFCVQCIYKEFR